jgi:hypothetical protein
VEIWAAFWRELNTPDRFAAQPYYGLINQIGHITLGGWLTNGVCALWVQTIGLAPPVWTIGLAVVATYVIVIELIVQRWVKTDTVQDSAFFALGAAEVALTMNLTPSGRWIRVEDFSANFLIGLAFASVALAVSVWPRLIAAYGSKD